MTKNFVIIFSALIIFTGCTDDSSEENQDPLVAELDDINNNEETETDVRPPNLQLHLENTAHATKVSGYCFMKDDCALQMGELEEILKDREPIRARGGDRLNLLFSSPAGGFNTPPDRMELTRVRDGAESEEEISNDTIIVPDETRSHYYRLHAFWEGEVYGEANYYFEVFVRE